MRRAAVLLLAAACSPCRVVGDTLILGADSVTHWRFTRVSASGR